MFEGREQIVLEEALSLIQSRMKQIEETEACPLLEAVGRVAAADIKAKMDQPPFPRSPLDGYGVYAADIETASDLQPARLTVTGELLAGEVPHSKLQRGQAVRIMTGAPLPEGADAVVPQEDTDYGKLEVCIYKPVKSFGNYCNRGEDFQQGDILIRKGERLDAARIAIAAAMGYDRLSVIRLPRIVVLTTGSELQEPGEVLKPGKIYDANRFLVGARLLELGICPLAMHKLPDEAGKMAEYIREIADRTDLIITTGGVSVGKKDILHDVLPMLEAKRLFWKVRMKPGSPVMASLYQNTCILSLSGNPFGVAAGLEVLVRPILYYLTGHRSYLPERKAALLEADFKKESTVMRLVRGIFRDGRVSVPEGSLAAGVLSTLSGCNCLIEIPAGTKRLNKGAKVWVILM